MCSKKIQIVACIFKIRVLLDFNIKVNELPIKTKKKKTSRYLNYFILKILNQVLVVQKQKEKEFGKNLYEFPVFESESAIIGK